jgi:hypothetical protein
MDMNMIAYNINNTSDQHKDIKQQIIIIDTKLEELRIFYITYCSKYDYQIAETFFKNLQDFIEKEYIKDIAYLQARFGDEVYFIRYYTSFNRNILNRYIEYSKSTYRNNNTCEVIKSIKQEADTLFNIICDEKEDKLYIKKLLLIQKLNHYENIIEHNKKKRRYLIYSCIMIVITTIITTKLYHYIY